MKRLMFLQFRLPFELMRRDALRYRAYREHYVAEHPRLTPESFDAWVDGMVKQQEQSKLEA